VARERVLTLGLRTANQGVEVKSGLSKGETLVVRGAEALRDGAAVRVVAPGTPVGAPPGGKPGEGKPGEGKPGEGKPGEGKPAEGKPAEGKPAEGKPAEGKPAEGKPAP
jgi:membrane fusion protein (multidrug efflux system)/multidrug efflux system membrane fusion protein